MEELDVIWMAVLAGSPLVGALLAGLAPRKWPDLGAWIMVLSTALSLSLAIAVLIQYRYDTLEQLGVLNDIEFRHKGSLDYRSLAADRNPDPAVELSTDWLGRTAWLNRFGLEWLWGMDGVGMACSLAVAACALSIAVVVWRPSGNPEAWRSTLLCLEAALLAACSQQNLFFLGLLMALAVVLAALLCRFSGARAEAGPLGNPAGWILRPGFVATGLTLVGGLILLSRDCHDFAPPDRMEEAAWRAVRSTPGAVYTEEYAGAEYHTLDLTVLARLARAAWHGHDLEALSLERLRMQQKMGLREDRFDRADLLLREEAGLPARLESWRESRWVVYAGWSLAVAAVALLVAALGYSEGGGARHEIDGAGGMARAMLSALFVILLLRVVFPLFPTAFAPGEKGGPGLALLAGLLLLGDVLFRLWNANNPWQISTLLAWTMAWVAWLGVFAWPTGGEPESLAMGLNGALLAGVCIPLGMALSRGLMVLRPNDRGAPLGLALLVQAGVPLSLGAMAMLPVARALYATSALSGVLFVLAYAVMLYCVAARGFLFEAAGHTSGVTVADPWKPRQKLVAMLLPVPLILTGILPYLVTSWTEPAATSQADLLERMPQLAPGQGMTTAKIPGKE